MHFNFVTESGWINLLIFLAGLYVLIKGSDLFVDAASAIARKWHVPELVIGLTLVSIGTSIPELATSILAQIGRDSDFVIGNIMGSNVTNITLILGAAIAFGGAMDFPKKLFTRDVLYMTILFFLTAGLFFLGPRVPSIDGISMVFGLHWIFGILLLAGAGWYSYFLFVDSDAEEADGGINEDALAKISLLKEFGLLILGLIMIFSGSKGMVDTVQWSAMKAGVSTMLISATIVAFGTSVPELAVTIMGVVKKKYDMAIGNIVGSCTFNILLIFGVTALINPLGINSGREGIINVLLTLPAGLMLLIFMALGLKHERLERWTGFVFLLAYALFLSYNICASTAGR